MSSNVRPKSPGELAGPRLRAGRAGPDADDQPGHDAGVDEGRAFEQHQERERAPVVPRPQAARQPAAAAPATKRDRRARRRPSRRPRGCRSARRGLLGGTCRAKKIHSPRNTPLSMYSFDARKSWRSAPGEMWFVVPPGRRKVGAGPDTFPPAAGTPEDRDRAGTRGRLSDSEYGADPTNERRSLFRKLDSPSRVDCRIPDERQASDGKTVLNEES